MNDSFSESSATFCQYWIRRFVRLVLKSLWICVQSERKTESLVGKLGLIQVVRPFGFLFSSVHLSRNARWCSALMCRMFSRRSVLNDVRFISLMRVVTGVVVFVVVEVFSTVSVPSGMLLVPGVGFSTWFVLLPSCPCVCEMRKEEVLVPMEDGS